MPSTDDTDARAVRRVFVAAGAVMLSALAGLMVVVPGGWAGPVLVVLWSSHGVHLGDLLCVMVWAVGMGGCVRAWLSA